MTGRPAWIPSDSVCQEAGGMASNGRYSVSNSRLPRYVGINPIRQTGRV